MLYIYSRIELRRQIIRLQGEGRHGHLKALIGVGFVQGGYGLSHGGRRRSTGYPREVETALHEAFRCRQITAAHVLEELTRLDDGVFAHGARLRRVDLDAAAGSVVAEDDAGLTVRRRRRGAGSDLLDDPRSSQQLKDAILGTVVFDSNPIDESVPEGHGRFPAVAVAAGR